MNHVLANLLDKFKAINCYQNAGQLIRYVVYQRIEDRLSKNVVFKCNLKGIVSYSRHFCTMNYVLPNLLYKFKAINCDQNADQVIFDSLNSPDCRMSNQYRTKCNCNKREMSLKLVDESCLNHFRNGVVGRSGRHRLAKPQRLPGNTNYTRYIHDGEKRRASFQASKKEKNNITER